MNKRQMMRYKMILNVHEACITFEQVWRKHPGFNRIIGKLEEVQSQVNSAVRIQMKPTHGITQTKLQSRIALADTIMLVSGAAISYAMEIDDRNLAAQVKVNRSALLKIRDVQILPICHLIYEEVMQRLGTDPLIEEFGINHILMDDLLQKMNDFEDHNTGPRQAIGYRKTATRAVDDQIRHALMIIESQLDGLMPQMQQLSPEFYAQYWRMRKQVKVGSKEKVIEIVEEGEMVEEVEEVTGAEPGMNQVIGEAVKSESLLEWLGLVKRKAAVLARTGDITEEKEGFVVP